MELTELSCCVDCMYASAYGETGEFPSVAEYDRWEAAFEVFTSKYHVLFDGTDLGFSWQPCELCGSPQGGDRFKMYMEEK